MAVLPFAGHPKLHDGFGLHDHAFAAAKGAVIGDLMFVSRLVADIVHPNLESDPARALPRMLSPRGDSNMPGKRVKISKIIKQTFRRFDHHSSSLKINLQDDFSERRNQYFLPSHSTT